MSLWNCCWPCTGTAGGVGCVWLGTTWLPWGCTGAGWWWPLCTAAMAGPWLPELCGTADTCQGKQHGQAWPRGREHRASLASQEQHYNQGSRKELVGALIMTANNFTQQLSSRAPNTAKPSLQTHSKHRLSPACTLSGCPVRPLT